jgi:DNA-binding MarR family transcriptional regulator
MKEAGQYKALEKQRKVIEVLQRNHLDVRLWEVLVLVGSHEGLSLQELLPKSSLPKSTLGRFVQLLSCDTLPQRRVSESVVEDAEPEGVPRLVESKVDPEDYRKKNVYLTTAGRKVLEQIRRIIEA